MPSRPYPRVGMPVRVVYLGAVEEAVIDEVRDDRRTLVIGDDRFTLRRAVLHARRSVLVVLRRP